MELLMLHKDGQRTATSIGSTSFGLLLDTVLEAPENSIFILSSAEGKELTRMSVQIENRLAKIDGDVEKEKAYTDFTDEYPGNLLMYIITISVHPEISRFYRMVCVNLMSRVGCYAVYFADPLLAQKKAGDAVKAILRARKELRKNLPLS
jgi:hypothetical protein